MVKTYLARAAIAGSLILGAAAMAAAPAPAEARVRVGIGIGIPLFAPAYAGPAYYPRAYYPPAYYPPAYYPAPYAYAPAYAPVYVQPQQTAAPAPAAASSQCREYNTTTVIGGTPQQAVGTACLQPDGTWRIVN